MAKWDGKSKGTVLGYKIFVFIIKHGGVRSAYWLLYLVSIYYYYTQKTSNKAIYSYFKNRLGYSHRKAKKAIYKSYVVFGKIIIDKIAIAAGQKDQFTFEFDGRQLIVDAISEGNGSVLISAHVGNFEIARYFMSDLSDQFKTKVVSFDGENSDIKNYLKDVFKQTEVETIFIKDDLSHIFEITHALTSNETVVFTGDRFFPKTKTLTTQFFGQEAHFPSGPFLISSRLKVPVLFVYVMKERNNHYHLFARQASFKHRDAQALLEEYVAHLEIILKKYPYQWFNYYDFWDQKPD